jgi:hypothetical protein
MTSFPIERVTSVFPLRLRYSIEPGHDGGLGIFDRLEALPEREQAARIEAVNRATGQFARARPRRASSGSTSRFLMR